MGSLGRGVGLGIEVLNQSNYRLWKSCMESYLVSEDLWDVVGGGNTTAPVGEVATVEATREWTRKNAKAEFALKRTISSGVFENISRCTSASSIWQVLDQLFNKKNEARLQLLENELANAKQGESSISDFFIKVKNFCSEINTLNPEESISDARLKRYIIRGLRQEYTPFVTSVQGWATQPSLEEFENLLASQESLAMQVAGVKIQDDSGNAYVARRQHNFKDKPKNGGLRNFEGDGRYSARDKRSFKCFRCGKIGHFKRDCRVKETNMVESKEITEDEEWGKCFSVEVASLDNSIHQDKKKERCVIEGDDGEPITLKNVYHALGVRKNLLSILNAVDSGYYVLFGPKDVKFLKNIEELKADVVHTGTRVNVEDSETLKYMVSQDVVVDKGSSNIEEKIVLMPSEKENHVKEMQGERGSIDQEEGDAQDHGSMASQQLERSIVKHAQFEDERSLTTLLCFLASSLDADMVLPYDEVKCIKKRKTTKKENLNASKKSETWKLVKKSKYGQSTSYKRNTKIKRNFDGRKDRFNAWLLTRGFSEKNKKNYDGSFGHMAKVKIDGRLRQNKYVKHLHFNVKGPPRVKFEMIDKIKFKGEY